MAKDGKPGIQAPSMVQREGRDWAGWNCGRAGRYRDRHKIAGNSAGRKEKEIGFGKWEGRKLEKKGKKRGGCRAYPHDDRDEKKNNKDISKREGLKLRKTGPPFRTYKEEEEQKSGGSSPIGKQPGEGN